MLTFRYVLIIFNSLLALICFVSCILYFLPQSPSFWEVRIQFPRLSCICRLALIVLIYNTYIKLLSCNLNSVIFLPHKDNPLVHLQSHVLITDCHYLGSYVGVKELLFEFLGISFHWKGIVPRLNIFTFLDIRTFEEAGSNIC